MVENDPALDPEQQPPARPSDMYTTRELGRLIKYYREKVRSTPAAELKGVIRQIQRLIDKGIGFEDIALALENYANDEWRKAQDPRYSKHIRSFFTAECIKEWLTPRPAVKKPLQAFFDFKPTTRPKPVEPVQLPLEESDEL